MAVLSSIPEVGRVVRTTLLAEGSDLLQRRDFPALRSLYGTPVARSSRKTYIVVHHLICNQHLQNALYY